MPSIMLAAVSPFSYGMLVVFPIRSCLVVRCRWASFGSGPLAELCLKMDVGVSNYYSLASGFLYGKYRSKPDTDGMVRGDKVADYLNDRGLKILSALDTVEADTGARPAEIARLGKRRSPS